MLLALSVFLSLATPTPEEAAVRAAVEAFARAGDARDLAALEGLLDPAFRVVFVVNGQPQATLLSRDAYLGMARAGKIGGDTRTVSVEALRIAGPLALVEVQLAGRKATFRASLTLVLKEGRWLLVQDATAMTPTL